MPRAKPKPPAQWAASVIEQRPVLSLLAYAANARTHSDAQVAQIAASIREFGFVNPVLVDEGGEIIAGHGRVMAAKLLEMATVPTIERGGLSDAQKRGLRLADNKLAMNSGWDEALLAAELRALSAEEFDITLAGFDAVILGLGAEDSGVHKVFEVDTSFVEDRFWISIRGPLKDQADALKLLTEAMANLADVDVELGTVKHDA